MSQWRDDGENLEFGVVILLIQEGVMGTSHCESFFRWGLVMTRDGKGPGGVVWGLVGLGFVC